MSSAITAAAKLPITYERAREALEKCRSVDECKEWKNKAAALAAYGRQAKDPTLVKNAMHIQGRALRRMGEITAEVEPKRGGDRGNSATGPRAPIGETRGSFGASGGLKPHETKQVLRIAAIPEGQFETAFDGPKAPSMKALAKLGTKARPIVVDHLDGRDPEEFSAAIKARSEMRSMAEMCGRITPTVAVRGSAKYDIPEMKAWATTIVAWCERLERELTK